MPHQVVRPILQRLVTTSKPFVQRYVSKHYGEIAGSLAGIAISISAGDYYGAISGLTNTGSNGPPSDRNPAFGYYQPDSSGGGTIGGSSGSTQYQTLRTTKFGNRNRRRKHSVQCCHCCKPARRKHIGRSVRR